MRANRRRDTSPELMLRSALHHRGLRYRVDHPVRVPGTRLIRPDIVFTRARLAIFVDGCFWHSCPEHGTLPKTNLAYWGPKLAGNVERDERITLALKRGGWRVLRIWEHVPVDDAAVAVQAALAAAARS